MEEVKAAAHILVDMAGGLDFLEEYKERMKALEMLVEFLNAQREPLTRHSVACETFRTLVQNYLRLCHVRYWHQLTRIPDFRVREIYERYIESYVVDGRDHLQDLRELCETNYTEHSLVKQLLDPRVYGPRAIPILQNLGIDPMAISWQEGMNLFQQKVIPHVRKEEEENAWGLFHQVPFPDEEDILVPPSPPLCERGRRGKRIREWVMAEL